VRLWVKLHCQNYGPKKCSVADDEELVDEERGHGIQPCAQVELEAVQQSGLDEQEVLAPVDSKVLAPVDSKVLALAGNGTQRTEMKVHWMKRSNS
jgi:hypothetical protein